jgi:hypothetical protein
VSTATRSSLQHWQPGIAMDDIEANVRDAMKSGESVKQR